MNFAAPVTVHRVSSEGAIVGAVWTTARGQLIVTEPHAVRVCHRDHAQVLRAWSFRPTPEQAFVTPACVALVGRVRWIVASRADGTVVAWREDDEAAVTKEWTATVPDEHAPGTAPTEEHPITNAAGRAVRAATTPEGCPCLEGVDTVHGVVLRTTSLPREDGPITRLTVAGDGRAVLVVHRAAVSVVGTHVGEASLASLVGKKRSRATAGVDVTVDWASVRPGVPTEGVFSTTARKNPPKTKSAASLRKRILTGTVSALAEPDMLPTVLRAGRKNLNIVIDMLQHVGDLPETGLLAIVRWAIRSVDGDAFVQVLDAVLRVPTSTAFLTRCLTGLSAPEVTVLLHYLHRTVRGGNTALRARAVDWLAMLLDGHFTRIVLRGPELTSLVAALQATVSNELKICETLQTVPLNSSKYRVGARKLPQYCLETIVL